MSLYDDWKQLCENERSEAEYKKFWNGYFDKETAAYEKILGSGNNKISGTLKELADGFDMDVCEAVGFLDGINTSLEEELKLEELEADKPVEAELSLPATCSGAEAVFGESVSVRVDGVISAHLPPWRHTLARLR